MLERDVVFESDGLRLAGLLRTPDMNSDQRDGHPAVLLVHGSLEQDKDGNLLQKRDGTAAFKKNFFLEIARKLCEAGYAAFSWYKRGFGESGGRQVMFLPRPGMEKRRLTLCKARKGLIRRGSQY